MSKSSSREQRGVWGPARVIAVSHSAHAAQGAILLLALAALAPSTASAQDFSIGAGQTVARQIMNGIGDHGVIEGGGTVRTSAKDDPGVWMQNDNQMQENAGTIETSGDSAYGIYALAANPIVGNSGTIETSGFAGVGILSFGRNATIGNSGTIATSGASAYGIYATGTNAIIENSGSIATSEDRAYGIYSGRATAIISNSGTIATSGTNANGIASTGATAIIGNSGTIATSRTDAHGIGSSGATATVTNSGSIATSGGRAHGIYASGGAATVTNSGTIIAEQADAIRFNASGATLNLLAGSIIQGGLRFAGAGNNLNFGPGLNAMVTLTGSATSGLTVTAGNNPFVFTSTTVAVLDRTGFVLTDAMALGLAGDLATGATSGKQHCLPVLGSDDCAMTAWLAGFGSFGGQHGSATLGGVEHQRGGGLMGLEFASGGGIFVGAVGAHGRAGSAYQAGLQGGVAGGHARIVQAEYFAEFYAALGILQIKNERTVLNNSVVGGLETAKASQTGYFLSPAITLGRAFATDAGTLTPSLRLRYTGLQLGGYVESGASGLVIDSRMVHELELRAQLQLALPLLETESGTLSTTLRAGADLIHQHSADISGQLLGKAITFASGGDGSRLGSFAAAEFGYALTGGATLFGSLEAGIDTAGSYSGTVQAGVRGAF